MKARQSVCLLLLLCSAVTTLPAEKKSPTPAIKAPAIKNAASNSSQTLSTSSDVTNATRPLSEEKKQTLTYVLGQPKKPVSVPSPAQLLSPDRYEFYTFDDDGQIVKKLMSVKEIQRIIANNEQGSTGEQSSPIEYYQILTVTPDVQTLPSVSRINPHEPLFSIHDVIASVQNVLKAEIKQKQASTPIANQTTVTTVKPTTAVKVNTQKETPSIQSTTPSVITTKYVTVKVNTTTTPVKATTYRPKPQKNKTKTPKPALTTPVTTVTPATSTASPPSSEKTTMTIVEPQSQPLSLKDAHPGFLSNDSFADDFSQLVHLVSDSFKKEGIDVPLTTEKNEHNRNDTEVISQETQNNDTYTLSDSMTQVQIPINQDLAESVSSVLSQIASEISMSEFDSSSIKSTMTPFANDSEKITINDMEEISTTTEIPAETTTSHALSLSWLKGEEKEGPTTVVEEIIETSTKISPSNVIKPQNKPRPFQKVPETEQLITSETGALTEEKIKSGERTTPKIETSTQNIIIIPSNSSEQNYQEIPMESKIIGDELIATFVAEETTKEYLANSLSPENAIFITTLSHESVTQSAENTKPTTEKMAMVNMNTSKNSTNETLNGVFVIQGGDTGRIPRPTQKPLELVTMPEGIDISTTESAQTEGPATEFRDVGATDPSDLMETTTSWENPETVTIATEDEHESEATTISQPQMNEEGDGSSHTDNVGLSFVPMLIRTTETDEVPVTTESIETTEFVPDEMTTTPTEEVESKIIPESDAVAKNDSSPTVTSTVKIDKVTQLDIEATKEAQDMSQVGALKHQLNKPFGKPQKPLFIKPSKLKPQQEAKPAKPSLASKPTTTKEPPKETENKRPFENHLQSAPSALELEVAPDENLGLEASTANLDPDVKKFSDLCNELAFSLWSSITHNGLSFVRSVVVSPFAVTSLLAMVFLGARGPTSGQMNDVLKLDDMVTFNPHLVFRNVTESLVISRNPGVATAAFVRELYSDRSKGRLLDFYKERAQQFYDGHVEEVNFKAIGDVLRRQTNHLVKRQTWGKITDFLRGSNLALRPPLAAFSANIFQTDCSRASTKDRDGEMYFVILPASRLRRLVPVPAVVWRDGFLAGYEPNLDATAVSISPVDSVVSTIFVLPGQQGLIAPGDSLARLEHHLLGASYRRGHWTRLMRSLLPRPGLELQIPRLSHKSVINVTTSLQRMGLRDLFSADKADLTGLNGLANDLHLSDMLQVNLFSTCGEEPIGGRHHSEIYPATPLLRREKSADNIFSESIESLFAVSDFEDPAVAAMPLELRPRQARIPLSKPGARIPEPPRLRFDRPFLFFVRHNPTGLILHMGRFNPRLMP